MPELALKGIIVYTVQCMVVKRGRNLIGRHSTNPAVAQVFAIPLKNVKIAQNNEVLKAGSGTLVSGQHTKTLVKACDYIHCINCSFSEKKFFMVVHV